MKNGEYILVCAPDNFPGKKYRDKYCLEHHLIYFLNYGVVPKEDEIIHHINGNKYDNRIENLQLLTKKEHNKIHRYKNVTNLVKLKCPICNKVFIVERRNSLLVKRCKSQCCCKDCAYTLDALRRTNNEKYLKLIQGNIISEFVGDKRLIG